MKIEHCRACGAEIGFIKTKAFRTVPVDAEPVWIKPGDGFGYILPDGSTIQGQLAGDADDDPDGNLIEAYISHFATCTEPDAFRKRKGGRKNEKAD